jgi:hypothetical protein
MRCFWGSDDDSIARRDRATCDDDAHNTCLTNQLSLRRAPEYCRSKACLKLVELLTGIAQAGDSDYGGLTNLEFGAGRQSEEIDTACSDVLADIAWMNHKSLSAELFKELFVNEVYLSEVGLRWILRYTRAVFDSYSAMSISFDAEPCEQLDAWRDLL